LLPNNNPTIERSQMATKNKTAPHVAALATVNDLDDQERAARANRDEARARLADLQARNQSGDYTVTGVDIMTARADVEAAEGLAAHAARVLADARAKAAAALAEHTAQEVRNTITLRDLDKTAQEATSAISAALASINDAMVRRDAASDAAGRALADAGVPPSQWLNGIRYVPVRQLHGTGPVVPGQYNVEVQVSDGGTAWVSSAGNTRGPRRELTRIIDLALTEARATVPVERAGRHGVVTI
jgi:hypothetical protein